MRCAYPPYGPESGLLFHSKFNNPVIPAWIRHSRGGGNGIQRHGWYIEITRKYLLLDSRHQWNDGRVTNENLCFQLCWVGYRKNKNFGKPVHILRSIPYRSRRGALTSNIAEHAVFGFMFLAQLRKCVEFYETRISPYQCQIMPCRREAELR
uniref:Uncharacterized protein n=1 Tax=Candidatus Kentrum sp. LPFa TaxID=2126335 RepID=A0A450W2J7_9GAMM|nr:MAG: hypothetical protein BECKLPF1236A_GA0070988_100523 [Candidatus Kentron sp. LPFa]VFK33489.1 MAG: hypothetical protein BECKLPF1236C_GA0070990_102106 [Candidatus Kentron sp. LPFa]